MGICCSKRKKEKKEKDIITLAVSTVGGRDENLEMKKRRLLSESQSSLGSISVDLGRSLHASPANSTLANNVAITRTGNTVTIPIPPVAAAIAPIIAATSVANPSEKPDILQMLKAGSGLGVNEVNVTITQKHDDLSWVRSISPPPPPNNFPAFVTAPVEELHRKLFIDVFQLLMDEGLFFNTKKMRDHSPFEYLTSTELRQVIDFTLPDTAVSHEYLLELIHLIIKYQPHLSHPFFMEQRIAGVEPYSCISDMIATCTNSNNVLYIVSTTTTLLELELIRAICQLVGYDAAGAGDGTITPGSSLANGYAMRMAIKAKFPTLKKNGLSGCKRPVIFVSERSVYIHLKCAIFQGFGTDSIIPVLTHPNGKMNLEDLRMRISEAVAAGFVPCMIVGTAGTSILRAIDPLEKIADICEQHDLWFHVDGTWGGSLLCSETLRTKLKGIERSDSLTWSQHYVLGVPPTCSCIVVPPRHKDKLTQYLGLDAGYSNALNKTPLYDYRYDIGHNTIISCRRPDMFKFWLLWKAKGIKGMGKHVDHIFKNAQICLEEMKKREGFHPILEKFEGTNICFVYVPLNYRSIIIGSEEYREKMSKLCLSLKRVLVEKGVLSLSYNELRESKSTFLVLGLHNSVLTRADIIYALECIEGYAEALTNPKHRHHVDLNEQLLIRRRSVFSTRSTISG